ncbi:hypothetical protein [Nocardia sp. XZ_19_369]|uniref:hypothetical protein n=1 Tax=Nocardia sp. XZ_19_369 TaxID=2769487 RepID=UPI0018904E0B|nr:hypothetical protein [Nocardia sp. XZ_19_369]
MTGGVDDGDTKVWELLSEPRTAPYLRASNGDRAAALALYLWSARTAAASFEMLGHLEVLLRNALDGALRDHCDEHSCGIPWFLLPTPGGEVVSNAVEVVRTRLRPQGRETRDQIVAGLSFGFWSGLLGVKYEQLWRDCLHHAFPNSSGRRKQVASALEGVRKFRNRLAHHDSMLNLDVPFEIRRIIEVAGYIDHDAAKWLTHISAAMETYAERPIAASDTVVVAARSAWPLYQKCHAYVCQAGRTFRAIERIAFYTDSVIQPDVPLVRHRRDGVDWSADSALSLSGSQDSNDRKIASVIETSRALGWTEGVYQVFLLSHQGDPQHRSLPSPIRHQGVGRGSAFTQRQRYVSLHALETAATTADL